MWSRYNAFLLEPPELTVAWQDPETGARGWLVINSLRGGAAGGGTRMRLGANPREVGYLAKTMELKFALAGPPIGGAKSGIDFDPRDPRKREVLERWYAAIRPYLRDHYGTGGDLNVDEVHEVIPIIQALGLEHPQEGIVRGHLRAEGEAFRRVIGALDRGVKAPVADERGVAGREVAIADVITGYGVARSVLDYHDRIGRSIEGTRVSLEGFGNVGAAAGLYLARAGARLVAVSDADKALLEPEGMDAERVERLMVEGPDRLLPEDPRCHRGADRDVFFRQRSDVFVCAAASGTLTEERLEQLAAAGVQVLACGANQPFRERQLGSTRVHRIADGRFAVLTDFLANLGMARTFSYLMEEGSVPDTASIFQAVDDTIGRGVDAMLERATREDRGLM
ncbi:MAG: amino acid dehydrogenase, partial [Gemmatimonadetes bacterium]|nr:amino acid dehydrogenase [Gemmatimonadota bacterium]NIQ59805.1 amino acid dehydrogenase [Gemmatimonadota bacterium]NIU80008.1 amino acid dehydrogenase [Gammaproteobacteria bacterium]NIX48453.1 amino acid dehydrogenase [Gemmatimonadota bacterium]NIY12887.1 amino acid dehydrogenase [Gemmatimonadota bacterium]